MILAAELISTPVLDNNDVSFAYVIFMNNALS